jgi:prevent-host-death family protein
MNDVAEPSVTCAQARERFDDLLERAVKHKERVVLTRRGKPVAALVPIEDLNFLEAIEDQLDAEEFQRAKEEFERSGEPAIPLEEVVRKLGIKA